MTIYLKLDNTTDNFSLQQKIEINSIKTSKNPTKTRVKSLRLNKSTSSVENTIFSNLKEERPCSTSLNLTSKINSQRGDKRETNQVDDIAKKSLHIIPKIEIIESGSNSTESPILSPPLNSSLSLFSKKKNKRSSLFSKQKNKRSSFSADESKGKVNSKSPISLAESNYRDNLKNFLEENNLPLHRSQIYKFLLRPDQEKFRKDFLIAGPWMDFVQQTQKNKKSGLVHEMKLLYCTTQEDEQQAIEQKKVILQFAIALIEHKIFTEEQMKELMNIVIAENELHSILLSNLIKDLQNIKVKHLEHVQDIEYIIENKNEMALVEQFEKIARGKMNPSEQKKFIKDFSISLSVIASNSLKGIHIDEFCNQAWEKHPEHAPNIAYYIKLFNQLGLFLKNQILSSEKKNQRLRVHSAVIQLTRQLIEDHNYSFAMPCLGALQDPNITRTLPSLSKENSKAVDEISELFSPFGDFRNLKNAMKSCEEMAIPYTFNLEDDLKKLILVDDGNPSCKDGMINLHRLELCAKILKNITDKQKNLQWRKNLAYDVEKAMKVDLDDNQIEKRSLDLVPEDPKLRRKSTRIDLVQIST